MTRDRPSHLRIKCRGAGCRRPASCCIGWAQAEWPEPQTPDAPPEADVRSQAPADPVFAEGPAPAHRRHRFLCPHSVAGAGALWGLRVRILYAIVGLRPVNLSPPTAPPLTPPLGASGGRTWIWCRGEGPQTGQEPAAHAASKQPARLRAVAQRRPHASRPRPRPRSRPRPLPAEPGSHSTREDA